jgi:hypothetical protein
MSKHCKSTFDFILSTLKSKWAVYTSAQNKIICRSLFFFRCLGSKAIYVAMLNEVPKNDRAPTNWYFYSPQSLRLIF